MDTNAVNLAQRLYERLPAVYRVEDAKTGGALRDLIAVIAGQMAAVQESIEQAYDDLFIETCAAWVVPYIGDLIGAAPLHGKAPGAAGGRADVANTLGLRRRKGTLAALEHSARSVTGFPAVAVEFFERMITAQSMNHVRPDAPATLSLRDPLDLERIASPFSRATRTFEARRITSGRGRWNIPNIGIFLYRIQSYGLSGVTAARIDSRRYTFNPLGIDAPLYNEPETETRITQFAAAENVPMPLTRLALRRDFARQYGPGAAVHLTVDGTRLDGFSTGQEVIVCNLADDPDNPGAWLHTPPAAVAIDPVLGRIALPAAASPTAEVIVRFRYGFSDGIGGGSYERGAPLTGAATHTVSADAPDLQGALDAAGGVEPGSILEFADSRTYLLASRAPNLSAAPGASVVIRARNGQRPLVRVTGGDWVIEGGAEAIIEIDGLALAGGALRITGSPRSVTLRHCTLVPGADRTRANEPASPGAPSLIIEPPDAAVTLESCVTGAIQAAEGCAVTITRSILDATDETLLAYRGLDSGNGGPSNPGGALTIENSTVIGRVHARELTRASGVIFSARSPAPGDLPVRAERAQSGCVRFSLVPPGSRTPRRYHCVLGPARFTSTRWGVPGYAQLSTACAAEIRSGAEDESEMGVFHDLYLPQRESDLRTRAGEYLRFGMELGVFYAS